MSYLVLEQTERLRFEVRSTTKADETRQVDMCENEGSGQCDCWMFRRMIEPQLQQSVADWRSKKPKPFTYEPEERHQCPHIRAVIRYLANVLVQATRKEFPDDNSKGQAV